VSVVLEMVRRRGDGEARALGTVAAGTELSAATAVDVRAAVTEAIQALEGLRAASPADAGVVRVLLHDVARHDVYGLGLLLGLHRQARRQGVLLVYVDPSPALLASMRRHGLHKVLAVEVDLRSTSAPRPGGHGGTGGR